MAFFFEEEQEVLQMARHSNGMTTFWAFKFESWVKRQRTFILALTPYQDLQQRNQSFDPLMDRHRSEQTAHCVTTWPDR